MPPVQYQIRLSIIVFAVGALAGCQPGAPDGTMPAAARNLDPPEQNGARIYYTGASRRGGPVSRTGGTAFGGSMMGLGGAGSWLTCASCHGPEGRGGSHAMHMRVMKARDIRYAALSTMPELKGRQSPYGLDCFQPQRAGDLGGGPEEPEARRHHCLAGRSGTPDGGDTLRSVLGSTDRTEPQKTCRLGKDARPYGRAPTRACVDTAMATSDRRVLGFRDNMSLVSPRCEVRALANIGCGGERTKNGCRARQRCAVAQTAAASWPKVGSASSSRFRPALK